ncbi:MAG: FHA domain-containing protein [Cyanobacteria bacterium J06634_6]
MDATDRLKKRIDTLQSLIEQHITPDEAGSQPGVSVYPPIYPPIYQGLEALRQAMTTPRLVINIVGDAPTAVSQLQATMVANEALRQHYKINAASIPAEDTPSAIASVPILKLQPHPQPATASGQAEETIYGLSQLSQQIIGRNPAAAQILLGDSLTLVSGRHAEMQLMDGCWHVRDLESRNGTFINGSGQRLQGWQALQVGDRISLGSPASAPGSASFVYAETPVEPTKPPSVGMSSINTLAATLNCNVLCIILDLEKPPTAAVQALFKQSGKAGHITEIVVVGDSSATSSSQADSTINWLQQQTFSVPVNYKQILKPAPSSPVVTAIQPSPGESTALEAFIESLSKLAKRRFDKLFADRIKAQIATLAAIVEQQIVSQKLSLQEAIAQLNNPSTTSLPPDFKETAREAQRKVSSDKDWFFRQVKNELMQAKADILNDFKNSSITNKLSQFIGSMSTQTSKQKGAYCMRLHAPDGNANVHEQTMALISSELASWVQHEWEKVAITHVSRGFQGLVEQSRETLKIAPALTLPPTLFAPLQTIDPYQDLQGSLVAHETESRYPKQNILSYLLKNLRGQLFGIVGLLSIVGGGFGIISGGRNTLMLIAAPVVIIFLCFAFLKERKANQAQAEEKLKKETLTYYQSIAKDMADRQVRRLTAALELEDRKFKEALEQVAKVYVGFVSKAEQSKKENNAQLKDYDAQLNAIEKDCSMLQRLQTGI